jgi:hypothetical protein
MSKLNLMICPHDTAKNPEKWFRFLQYLNRNLDFIVQLTMSLDFKEFRDRLSTADLVYANPTDGANLVQNEQFIPIVRSTNLSDEVVFIANPNLDNPSLQSYQGSKVATVSSMVTKLATSILHRQNIMSTELVNKDSWLGVINSVAKNEASLGFVYKDTYDELSPKTKEMITAIATSSEHQAFHALYLSPKVGDRAQAISSALQKMHLDPMGQDVLKELKITAWESIPADALQSLLAIAS